MQDRFIHNLNYVFGDRSEEFLPWSLPDMARLKIWYRKMVQLHPELNHEFDFTIFGRFWSNQAQHCFAAQVFLTVEDSLLTSLGESNSMTPKFKSLLEDGYRIALAELRLPLDLGVTTKENLEAFHEDLINIELEMKTSIDESKLQDIICLPYFARFWTDNQWQGVLNRFPKDADSESKVLGLVTRPLLETPDLVARILEDNLIHFKPASLFELFAPLDVVLASTSATGNLQ